MTLQCSYAVAGKVCKKIADLYLYYNMTDIYIQTFLHHSIFYRFYTIAEMEQRGVTAWLIVTLLTPIYQGCGQHSINS